MCELFAMSSKFETDVNLSLGELSLHGGGSAPHGDGWGVAYAMGRDFRIIKEPEAAYESDCVQYIQNHHFKSRLVLSHIRQASAPKKLSFMNTHPFDRELFGRRFVFIHNGFVEGAASLPDALPGPFQAMGDTDSEWVFVYLLNRIYHAIGTAEAYHHRKVEGLLEEVSPQIRQLGKFNFILSDGEVLFAHGDTSLYSTCRSCHRETDTLSSDSLRVITASGPEQNVVLVATVPLSNSDHWERFQPGEIRVFRDGSRI